MSQKVISTKKMRNPVIAKRRIIQAIIGVILYFATQYFHISLWYVLIFGTLTGLIFGKVFCRWMCPLGFIMEVFMNMNPEEKFKQTYQYHKLGCPIAWISGVLNKLSILKIHFDDSDCKQCGACDKACYISTLNEDFSLYKKDKKNPSRQFSCSKCLQCVAACPKGSLKYKFQKIKL
jgi:polyferredoxin